MMKYKTIFLDKNFWSFIYRPIFGCISQSVTISASLIILVWLTGSFATLKDALQSIRGLTIFFSVFLAALANIGILVVSLNTIRTYILFTPIDSKPNPKDIKDYLSNKWNVEFFTSFKIPLGLFIVSVVVFVIVYASGENWGTALLKSILYLLPFHVASFVMYLVSIGIHIILLHLRFIFQRNGL